MKLARTPSDTDDLESVIFSLQRRGPWILHVSPIRLLTPKRFGLQGDPGISISESSPGDFSMQADLTTIELGRLNIVVATVGLSDCSSRMNYMEISELHRGAACPASLQGAF